MQVIKLCISISAQIAKALFDRVIKDGNSLKIKKDKKS